MKVRITEHDAFVEDVLKPLDDGCTIADAIETADEIDEILQALDPVLEPDEYLAALATLPWERNCDNPMRSAL